ncbi:MAG: hypothetical protein AB1894_10380 [Chloroflexota bacterium]
MKRHNKRTWWMLFLVISLALAGARWPGTVGGAAAQGLAAIGIPDYFGYNWDDGAGVQIGFIDASGGTEITFDDNNNGVSITPISLASFNGGDGFWFYEENYTQLYVGTNGIVGFTDSIYGYYAGVENLAIPSEYVYPQAFVAPFWADLIVGGETNSGKVVYQFGVDPVKGDYLVVEWYQITRVLSSDLLTFEVILYEDGDILVQYDTLTGSIDPVTVGIEDGEGVDGLEYHFNGTGQTVAVGKDVLFIRPDPAFRTKAFPLERQGFIIDGRATFDFYVRNTGEKGADAYTIEVSPDDSGILLYDQTGASLPKVSGKFETPALSEGQTFMVKMVISLPGAAVAAEKSTTLIVRSQELPTRRRDLQFRAAMPSAFAVTYREGNKVNTDLVSSQSLYTFLEHDEYRGSTFLLSAAGLHNYFALWEHNEQVVPYTHLYALMFSGAATQEADKLQLTSHSMAGAMVRDYGPAAVVAPNGNIGLAWHRDITILADGTSNSNIYFAVLDPTASSFVQTEVNVTQISTYFAPTDPDKISFRDVRIAASGDNRFSLGWIKAKGVNITDMYRMAYQSDGSLVPGGLIAPAPMLAENLGDSINYTDPALEAYLDAANNQRVLALYFERDRTSTPVDTLYYMVLNSNGNLVSGPTALHVGSGAGPDLVQLSSKQMAVAWIDATGSTNRVAFQILPQNLSSIPAAQFLSTPDGRPARAVSVTRDASGRAVLTWCDNKWYQRLYYALVSSSAIHTQPLAFRYLQGSDPALVLETNATGQGNAPYTMMYRMAIPFAHKH